MSTSPLSLGGGNRGKRGRECEGHGDCKCNPFTNKKKVHEPHASFHRLSSPGKNNQQLQDRSLKISEYIWIKKGTPLPAKIKLKDPSPLPMSFATCTFTSALFNIPLNNDHLTLKNSHRSSLLTDSAMNDRCWSHRWQKLAGGSLIVIVMRDWHKRFAWWDIAQTSYEFQTPTSLGITIGVSPRRWLSIDACSTSIAPCHTSMQ